MHMWHRRSLREALSGMQGEEGDTMSEVEDNPYDVDRFRRVMAGITDDVLDMDVWAEETPCGTVACFAGHVVLEAGRELAFQENETRGTMAAELTISGRYIPDLAVDLLVPGSDGMVQYRSTMSKKDLKLLKARRDIHNLFMSSARTKDELWDAIEDYTEGMVTRA